METPIYQPEDFNITYIPHDFKVACKLFNLPIRKLIQLFIDHVSFYDSVCETKADMYKLATRTLVRHHQLLKADGKAKETVKRDIPDSDRQKCVQLTRSIIAVSRQPLSTDQQRRNYAKPLVSDLSRYIGRITSDVNTLYLNGDALTLTPDFIVLCEINSIHPLAHVIHFMERISLADHWARRGLNQIEANPAMGFYNGVQNGYGNLNPEKLPHSDIMTDVVRAYQESCLSLFIYRSVDYRRHWYRMLLDKFYNQLIKKEK